MGDHRYLHVCVKGGKLKRMMIGVKSLGIRLRRNREADRSTDGSSGQAMLEYVIVAGMLLATVGIMAVFLYSFKEQGGRVLDLAASEYP